MREWAALVIVIVTNRARHMAAFRFGRALRRPFRWALG
jgi:hypothetical protein